MAKIADVPLPMESVGHLIRKQREAMKMTLAQLAKQIGVSRNTIINYESGKTEPNAGDLVRLASALGCTISDLLRGDTAPVPRFSFRAHSELRDNPSILASARKFLRSYLEIEEIMQSRLSGMLRNVVGNNDGNMTDRVIEMAADTIRQTSGLHDTGPENIVNVLEGLGIRTLFFQTATEKLDGLSTIQDGKAFILLRDSNSQVERTIFSAAHELGHLVLHPHLFTVEADDIEVETKQIEKQANTFAGYFLVPSDELIRSWKEEGLGNLQLVDALLILKNIFRVSIHCLFYRVTELGLTEKIAHSFFISQIKNKMGIDRPATKKELEPDRLIQQVNFNKTRFNRLIRSAFLQDLIGVAKVAEMLQINVEDAKEMISKWLRPSNELVEDRSV